MSPAMLLGFLTVVIMLVVAYCHFREGVLTAFAMLVNVLLAGLVAFGFYEPIATELDPMVRNTLLAGYEDALCLALLFAPTLGLLRLLTYNLTPTELQLPPLGSQIGAGLCGLVTGYLVSGFLVCLLQTLPLPREFMGFRAEVDSGPGAAIRRVLPPDRVWLAMMHRAGRFGLAWGDGPTFDADGSYEFRYHRLRRYPGE